MGTATRLGASRDITSHKSGIATTTELTSIAADMVSCNVVDKTAIVSLDTHVESSSEAAHQDLMGYAHASHSTTLAAMNTTLRVADETVIGRLRDEEFELENCFGQASMVRMPMADSQSKVSSMQSFARGTPNEYGKESWDFWHDIEYKELMKVLKIKSCKTKAWEPDNCVLVNFVKLIFCNASHPENWNILCPAVDSPIMWMFDGYTFQQTQTEATIYELVGEVAT